MISCFLLRLIEQAGYGRIQTVVKGFADLYLVSRPRNLRIKL